MLERFLFIGTGGTGGTVLHHTWAQLDNWLRARGYNGGMPEGWRFLHIDLPENADVVKGDVPAAAGSAVKYLNLGTSPRTYADYDRQLLQATGTAEALAGWRTDPAAAMPFPFDGAGQMRTVGNLVSLAMQAKIREALRVERTAMASQTATGELQDISGQLGLDIQLHLPDPTVVLVSSLGGGSGSGMFLNVIEMLMAEAANDPWLQQRLYTVLFTPEALRGQQTAPVGDGMEANSLAALCEFMNAFDHQGPPHALDERLFQAGGGGVSAGPRVWRYNFFVGRSNGKLGFTGPPAVAKAIGKALAVLAADDAVRGTFQDYVGVNWRGQPVAPGFTLTNSTGVNHSATALGYASVSLGRDIFARYAAERLARHGLDRLLRGHREHDPSSTRRDEREIEDRANIAQDAFFEASGLWEHSEANNQVLEQLCDKAGLRERIAESIKSIREYFSEDRRELTRSEAVREIASQFDDRAREVTSWAAVDRYERMGKWVLEVQRRLMDATAESIGTNGFLVTLELLSRLERQVRDAADELEADADKADTRVRTVTSSLQAILLKTKEKITPRDRRFITSIDEHEGDLIDLVERDLFRFASTHLRDVADGLLPPLRRAVASANGAIAQAETGGDRELVSEWSGRTVGSHLVPAKNELLLCRAEEFPVEFEDLLRGLFEGGTLDAESSAVAEVIDGRWLGLADEDDGEPEQTLFSLRSEWSPSSIGGRQAQFSLDLDLPGLLVAAERWVATRKGGMARYVREDIKSWLGTEDRAQADKRSMTFVAGLREALQLSAPLVTIGTNAYSAIHGGSRPQPTLAISRIPIGVGTRANGKPDGEARRYDEVLELLETAGIGAVEAEALCDPNAGAGAVEVMSFLGSSVHPMVFTSLTEPILTRWERCTNQEERRLFWDYRRTRQLTSFVPISEQLQIQLARGWIVASELGYVSRLQGRWSDQPLEVWSPVGALRFPAALLGPEPRRQSDVFPALLESLPLAMLRLGRDLRGEVDAYQRLLALGDLDGETAASLELEEWLRFGVLPDPVDAGQAHQLRDFPDMEARATVLLERLGGAARDFEENLLPAQITPTSSLTVTRRWETRWIFEIALHQVIARIELIVSSDRYEDNRVY